MSEIVLNPFERYPIKLTDVSGNQDNPETVKRPDIEKLVQAGFSGIMVRVGYGLVKDTAFEWFWSTSKGRMVRKPYWYGDYYSHKKAPLLVKNYSNYQWGTIQADKNLEFLNGDYGEAPIVWDAEESTYGGRITTVAQKKAYNEVFKGYFDRIKLRLGKESEIYCSPGFIPVFEEWARKLTLMVAWYDRTKTKDEIIKECRRKGWIGPIIIWQYASDGDINLDGAKDGLSLGMESEDMDLDAWIGLSETNSAEDIIKEWSLYLGGTAPINNQPDTPVITVPDATFKTMIVASPFGDGLNIRNKPKNINGVTEKWMPQGTLVTILETVKYNNDIWHRIGFDQWCAETYNNITYLKG